MFIIMTCLPQDPVMFDMRRNFPTCFLISVVSSCSQPHLETIRIYSHCVSLPPLTSILCDVKEGERKRQTAHPRRGRVTLHNHTERKSKRRSRRRQFYFLQCLFRHSGHLTLTRVKVFK